MRIILSGGGTGGHILPNLALEQTLKKKLKDLVLLYIGSKKGMEKELVEKAGLRFEGISCGKMRRYFSLDNFLDLFRTLIGIWQSYWIIKKFRAEIIFSKGGYVTFPVVVGGWLNGVPILTHESDLVPGLTTKLNSRFARLVLTSFEKTVRYFKPGKALFTGSMVREELAAGTKAEGLRKAGLDQQRPVLLVTGGSLGAAFINEWVWKNLDSLLKHFAIIHLCGAGKINPEAKGKNYFQSEFAGEEMKDFYAAADLVLCRAGANTLFELAFLNKPAVLVPLTRGSRGDQVDNAKEFAQAHRCLINAEEELEKIDLEKWAEKVLKLINGKNPQVEKRESPNETIANLIIKYAKKS